MSKYILPTSQHSNRLHLDFNLSTQQERAAFLTEYLADEPFITYPPSQAELDTMADYVLWGKDVRTGLNENQAHTVDLKPRHSTWSRTAQNKVESLDELIEQPTFNESLVYPIDSSLPMRAQSTVFSRMECRAKCPDTLLPDFEHLWRQIDELDYMIEEWELAHDKRTKPIRDNLRAAFSEEEQASLRATAIKWPQYQYLKRRHELVELRRQQYTLRDTYQEPFVNQGVIEVAPIDPVYDWDVGIIVRPLGLVVTEGPRSLAWMDWSQLNPHNFNEEELRLISDMIWEYKEEEVGSQQHFFDFRELEHVYQLILMWEELGNTPEYEDAESNLAKLMSTLRFYIKQAKLDEVQKEILEMKLARKLNAEIAATINAKWKKSYTVNYISTIFRQRIIPKINDAAREHEELLSNLFFEEEWKTCSECGRTFLLRADNFTRKSRSKDGYVNRCKNCEKKARNGG